ncbi:MAG: hypothetical protein AAFN77_22150 [Planctomycetota bacterium]
MTRFCLKNVRPRCSGFSFVFPALALALLGCEASPTPPQQARKATSSQLQALMVDGEELHESLKTQRLDSIQDLPLNAELPKNPYLSTDSEFIKAIASGGSQGQLDGDGIGSAFYARYVTAENELGIYGLKAKSNSDADRRESELRKIWAYNSGLDRAHVERDGLVIVVIWNDGVPEPCWQSVKREVAARISESGK